MPNNEPYDYNTLRTVIHTVFYDFFKWELECSQGNEFDFDFMEARTDDILRIIRRQGGQV